MNLVSQFQLALVVATVIIICLVLVLVNQLMQIRSIRKQVHFIARNKTNKNVTFFGKSRGIKRLSKDINDLIDAYRNREIEIMHKDRETRDTITNMSHDIRTPLTSLKGYFELLQETEDPEERAKYSAIIEERIDSLNEILETMFFYTKVDSAGYELKPTKVDMSAIVLQTLFSYVEEFEKIGLEPDIHIDENVSAIADESALKRVLQNLIKNVLVHGEGNVSVRLEYVEKRVVLEIGNGVRPDEIPDCSMVFDRFYKADSSRHVNSSGIGLSVAQKLVTKMNGTISASMKDNMFLITVVLPGIQ